MKMKLTATALAIVLAGPAFAGPFQGTVSLTWGAGEQVDVSDLDSVEGPFNYGGIDFSLGTVFDNGVTLQIDANAEIANDPSDTDGYYRSYGMRLHAGVELGSAVVGAFVGTGTGEHSADSDTGNIYTLGVEAAGSFGDTAIAGQIGLTNSANSHSSLDYNDQILAEIELKQFINDRFMIQGNIGYAESITHSDPGTLLVTTLAATFGLGDSNVYGTVGYRGMVYDNPGEGTGYENSVYLGVTVAFGGGSLRDSAAGTPMISSRLGTYNAIASSIVD